MKDYTLSANYQSSRPMNYPLGGVGVMIRYDRKRQLLKRS